MNEYWLCEECNVVCRTGDYTFLDYYYPVEVAMVKALAIQEGIGRLGADIKSNYTDATGVKRDGVQIFSSVKCDCCGTKSDGERFRYV